MRFMTTSLCALIVAAMATTPVRAGWDNVFQPTLFGRHHQQPTTAKYYAPPVVVAQSSSCPQPCPQPCTTQYIQRSYYQPVTAYETKTVMEPVTTYRTSYYYEPVTTVRYSSYYDPCTCSYSQVAVPTTCYQLREQKCPVQSWVSRCVQVPVQAYQKVDYWQPQTTCCQTTLGAPIYANGAPVQTPPPPPNAPEMRPMERPPEIKGSVSPSTNGSKPTQFDQFYPPIEPSIKTTVTPNTSWQPQLGAPVPIKPAPQPPAPVKLDRIAAGPNSVVEGTVVRADNSPKANAKVMFVNASTGEKQTINANSAGRFQTELPAGSWHVYVHGANDLPIYQNRIDVNGSQFRQVSLVQQ